MLRLYLLHRTQRNQTGTSQARSSSRLPSKWPLVQAHTVAGLSALRSFKKMKKRAHKAREINDWAVKSIGCCFQRTWVQLPVAIGSLQLITLTLVDLLPLPDLCEHCLHMLPKHPCRQNSHIHKIKNRKHFSLKEERLWGMWSDRWDGEGGATSFQDSLNSPDPLSTVKDLTWLLASQ